MLRNISRLISSRRFCSTPAAAVAAASRTTNNPSILDLQQAAPSSPPQTTFDYPSFVTSSTAARFLEKNFSSSSSSATAPQTATTTTSTSSSPPPTEKLGGRVVAVRDMGKLLFLTLRCDGEQLQVMFMANNKIDNNSDNNNTTAPAAAITKADVKSVARAVKIGDIVGVVGEPGVTKTGEKSIFARSVTVLTKFSGSPVGAAASGAEASEENDDVTEQANQAQQESSAISSSSASKKRMKKLKKNKKNKQQHQQQQEGHKNGLASAPAPAPAPAATALCPSLNGYVCPSDPDLLYRYRFIDLMCNKKSQDVFRLRSRIVSALRRFLDARDFLEVETPMFHTVPSGAAARPFRTHHEANDADLFLRVAPELYLKQCVVGGLERVYEIGRVFRNEGSDRSHNPEFTSCEFYQAYATYRELMPMTEALLREMCVAALGEGATGFDVVAVVSSSSSASSSESTATTTRIHLDRPFKVVDIIPELEAHLGLRLPRPITNLDSSEGADLLTTLLTMHEVPMPSPASPAKLFDKLIDHFITDRVVQPTFVVGHPLFMSPLAKEDPANPGVAERFELFINGMEICNAYSELNDPVEQKRRFEQQLKQRICFNDDEAQCVDEAFLKALQVGLPPTAGWGMGIDRVAMLLSGSSAIRDVILFPLLRQRASDGREAKRRRSAAAFFGFDPFMAKFCLTSLEAEFMRRGCDSANLVRSVQQALDGVLLNNKHNKHRHHPQEQDQIDNNHNVANNINDDNIFAGQQAPIESTAIIASQREHGNRSVTTTGNMHNNNSPDCSLMALVLLTGLRGTQPVMREKSEQALFDLALKALCDPAVAAEWWWKK